MSLQHKIDFAVIISVDHANPNGDPLNGNRPRTDYEGFGEISDVCLKRKMRDRLLEQGQAIFVQSDDRKVDGMQSLAARATSNEFGLGEDAFQLSKKDKNQLGKKDATAKRACAKWYDVRAFGQLFAFKAKKGKDDTDADGVSIAIRGPVSVQSAYSVEPVIVTTIQITKSVSGEGDGSKPASDTMGLKHRVDKGVYVFYGSINPQLAERTGFSDEDAATLKDVLPRLFENDGSSARPEGSMSVQTVFWWEHNCASGQFSAAKVHKSLKVNADGTYALDASATPGLIPEIIPGF